LGLPAPPGAIARYWPSDVLSYTSQSLLKPFCWIERVALADLDPFEKILGLEI
jgi:hypothetical protein